MEALLIVRDGISAAKHLITCVYLAASSPTMPENERAALCAVSNAARERLEELEEAIDMMIADRMPK